MKKMAAFFLLMVILSCGGSKEETILSDSAADLSRHMDFSKYNPKAVKFRYSFHDNSKGVLAGPSDSSMEAALYFDPETFRKLADEYKNVDYPAPELTAADFDFNWLDKELKDQLAKSPTEYRVHSDLSFRKSPTSTLLFLDNKVLLRHYVN